MAKIDLTYDNGQQAALEGPAAIAVAFNNGGNGRIITDAAFAGQVGPNIFLVETSRLLGSIVKSMVESSRRRELIYARMLNALREGFDGTGINTRAGFGDMDMEGN